MDCLREQDPGLLPLSVVYFIFGVAIFFGNLLTILAVARFPPLRTRSNLYIVSLAIPDALVGLLEICLGCYYLPSLQEAFDASKYLCVSLFAVTCFCLTCSLLNMCLIACDRYFYIAKPYRYEQLFTERSILISEVVAWTLSLVVGSFHFYQNNFSELCSCRAEILDRYYRAYVMGAVYVLSCILLVYLYGSITMVASKTSSFSIGGKQGSFSVGRSSITSPQPTSGDQRKISSWSQVGTSVQSFKRLPFVVLQQMESKKKIIAAKMKSLKLFLVVCSVFVGCSFPLLVTQIINSTPNAKPNDNLNRATVFILLLNSGLNVIIYPFYSRNFRTAFKKLFRCKGRRLRRVQRSKFQNTSRLPPSARLSETVHVNKEVSSVKREMDGATITDQEARPSCRLSQSPADAAEFVAGSGEPAGLFRILPAETAPSVGGSSQKHDSPTGTVSGTGTVSQPGTVSSGRCTCSTERSMSRRTDLSYPSSDSGFCEFCRQLVLQGSYSKDAPQFKPISSSRDKLQESLNRP